MRLFIFGLVGFGAAVDDNCSIFDAYMCADMLFCAFGYSVWSHRGLEITSETIRQILLYEQNGSAVVSEIYFRPASLCTACYTNFTNDLLVMVDSGDLDNLCGLGYPVVWD